MPIISIGDLFVIALLGTLISAMLASTAARPYGNTLAQGAIIISSSLGLLACIVFLSAALHGETNIILPGLQFAATPLSAFFLSIVYAVSILGSIFAIRDADTKSDLVRGALPMALLLFSIQLVLFAPSPFWFLLGVQAMLACTYFIVISRADEDALQAGSLFLAVVQTGFACLLAGFLIVAHGNPFV